MYIGVYVNKYISVYVYLNKYISVYVHICIIDMYMQGAVFTWATP